MAQLLGGNRYPVIPDMQRDYCWGLEKTASPIEAQKCTLFVEGLMRAFKAHGIGKLMMPIGLLYCYEQDHGNCAINIVDGQQRLTTLYLLMGMLYRRIPGTEIGNRYRGLLVSETGDGEVMPRLQYKSKTEAMYFLTDLVSKFFLSRHGRLSQIEHSKWYFKSYDADTNARSFLGAIRCIDAALERELSVNPGFDFEAFARFVAEEVVFWYYDLGSRSAAERAFITINTTSHPLTLAQKLRALAIRVAEDKADAKDSPYDARSNAAMAVARQWNDMDDWFWRHRPLSIDGFMQLAVKYATTTDSQVMTAQSFVNDRLPKIFAAYSRCVECGVDMANAFVAVPMLHYALRFGLDAADADIERMGHLLSNYTQYQKTGAADRQQAMDLVCRMPWPSIGTVLHMRGAPAKIINPEERAKIALMHENGYNKRLIRALRRAESHPMLRGRVAKVLGWCRIRSEFSVERLEHYVGRIYDIWGDDIDRRDDLDPVRRALLSLRHSQYPIVRRGDMVLSLCWKDYDWQRLMTDAPGLVRELIDHTDHISVDELAMRFNDMDYPYYFIINDERVLDGCRKRQLLRQSEPFVGIYYLGDNRTQWWVDQRWLHIDGAHWREPRPHGKLALHIDHRDLNASIGIVYTPNARSRFRVELFRRPDSPKAKTDLKIVADSLRHPLRYDRDLQRFTLACADAPQALKCVDRIMEAFSCGDACGQEGE